MTDAAADPDGLSLETIRPLELLHRAAEYLGAVVVLTSTADERGPASKRRFHSLEAGSQLSMLAVIQPFASDELDRWGRINRGTTLCSANIDDADQLNAAAMRMVDELHLLIDRHRH